MLETEKGCAWCGGTPIRDVLDGDPLCQECCDKWVGGNRTEDEEQFNDE